MPLDFAVARALGSMAQDWTIYLAVIGLAMVVALASKSSLSSTGYGFLTAGLALAVGVTSIVSITDFLQNVLSMHYRTDLGLAYADAVRKARSVIYFERLYVPIAISLMFALAAWMCRRRKYVAIAIFLLAALTIETYGSYQIAQHSGLA